MKLDLSEIARTPGAFAEHQIDVTLQEIEGMTLTAPIRGRMYISSTGRVLVIEGAVDTEVEMTCFRCGITYRQPIHAEFQEDFIIRPPLATGHGPLVEEEEEAPGVRLFYEGTFDLNLDELFRQSILVALPLKPICAEECKGLCPHCGHRLSEGECACEAEAVNPQMAVLQQLLQQRKQQ